MQLDLKRAFIPGVMLISSYKLPTMHKEVNNSQHMLAKSGTSIYNYSSDIGLGVTATQAKP